MATRAHALRALGSRNYRLYFGGQLVSVIGTWMQQVALSWLVYQMTHSAMMLGIVAFCGRIPSFALTPFAGLLADRFNRHRLLIVTQTFAMLQGFAMAALTLSGKEQLWELIALALVLGVVRSFDVPVRQSFVPEMIERAEDLPNAIALNSSVMNGARLIGPMVAGAVIAVLSVGACFLIDAVSYLAVLAALVAMRVPEREVRHSGRNPIADLREGLRYAFGAPEIRAILTLLAIVSLVGQPYVVLLPIYATQLLNGGAAALGYLTAAGGIGALIGVGYLASLPDARGLGSVLPLSAVCFGAGLIAFSFSRLLPLSMACLVLAGVGMMLGTAASNTVLQTIVADHMRGRVMAFYTLSVMGMIPIGGLLEGTLAHLVGAAVTTGTSGVIVALAGLWFAWKLPQLKEALARGGA
ncbi:MAG TPA: MFS transporter [Oscillatoriaceae cyanobacterium]